MIHKVRTEDELREALRRFCHAAWGSRQPGERAIFSIPPNRENDADMILSDGIGELASLRAQFTASQAEVARLRIVIEHLLLSADAEWERTGGGHDWPEAVSEARAALDEYNERMLAVEGIRKLPSRRPV